MVHVLSAAVMNRPEIIPHSGQFCSKGDKRDKEIAGSAASNQGCSWPTSIAAVTETDPVGGEPVAVLLFQPVHQFVDDNVL
jgi:hypothetical protein